MLFEIFLTALWFILYHFLYSLGFSSLKSAAKSINRFLSKRCFDIS